VIQPHGLPFVVDERLDRIVDLPTIIEVRNEIEWGFELELEIPVLRHHSYPADGDDLAIAVHHADPSGTLAVRGRLQLKTRSRTAHSNCFTTSSTRLSASSTCFWSSFVCASCALRSRLRRADHT